MNKPVEDFQKLIKPDKYQVFVFACPAYFPINFARHAWFVLSEKGKISRYEVRHFKGNKKHLFVNFQPPFLGTNITFLTNIFWSAKLLGFIEGDENSKAREAIEFIKNSENTYPYLDTYRFYGPNSNTYVQNVLNHFPEFGMNLSLRFIGKGFKV